MDTIDILPKENVSFIHKLTPETDSEYPVFTDNTNYNPDMSFICFGRNDHQESYMDYKSDNTCSS